MIDLKKRAKNKVFWVSLISLVIILLKQLGVELPFDLGAISDTILSILVLMGIIVDPTTQGITDGGVKDE